MCGERGSPGRCGWDEGREEGEKALEHALPSFRLLSLERVLVRHRGVELMARHVPSQAGNETSEDFETLFVSFPLINGQRPLTLTV